MTRKKNQTFPTLSGRVVEEQKNFYLVDTSEGTVRCSIRGILKKKKIRVCTGDLVTIEVINPDIPEGVIKEVRKRLNHLPRPPLANIEQIFFINSFKMPSLDLETIDRFLFSASVYGIDSVLVFNKSDLMSDEEMRGLEKICRFYDSAGYRTLYTSAKTRRGIEELTALCHNSLSAFAGLSGVGKSSLMSILVPERTFRTGEVSGNRGRGTHTTTHISLVPITIGGYIADTPGISFVNIPRVDENETPFFFPELESRVGSCRFNDCKHDEEPGCYIRELVEKGEIASWRHKHYLKIRNEMEQLNKKRFN
ncbi:Ribosome small subunit-stimulated GTPase EngC [Chitinispirillum alkaliphilum]|nr:Ribosome small subunit-stimulated GTPase EngC [Chitinispirillum alkaliphilum]